VMALGFAITAQQRHDRRMLLLLHCTYRTAPV
jgi:hypothetical protein